MTVSSSATRSMIHDARAAVTTPTRLIPPIISSTAMTRPGMGDRLDVAVADGGHRRDRPPQRLAERVDFGAGQVPLLVEDGQRCGVDQQQHTRDGVDHDAATYAGD